MDRTAKLPFFSLNALIPLLLIILTGLTFWPMHENDFIYSYDDTQYILDNNYVNSGLSIKNIIWAFSSFHAANWHPLTWISHMIDCQIFGLHAGGHLFVNLVLHILNVLLLFIFLKKTTHAPVKSALVAILFAIHPLRAESVAWIAERKDLLSTFFFFLSLIAYGRYVNKQRMTHYLQVIFWYCCSLLAKPMYVTLPFVLLLLDYWPLKRIPSPLLQQQNLNTTMRLSTEKLPFLGLAFCSSLITILAQSKGGAVVSLEHNPFIYRFFNAIGSYAVYLYKMVWPINLAAIYPLQGFPSLSKIIVSLLILLLITLSVVYFSHKYRFLGTGWFWYLGMMIPVIGLVQVGSQAYADRYTYIPVLGIVIILVWGIAEIYKAFKSPKKIVFFCSFYSVVILALMVLTRIQVRYWKNDISLFQHASTVIQNNFLAHNNLGVAYHKKKLYTQALDHYLKSVNLFPGYVQALNNVGTAYFDLGQYEEALLYAKKALKIEPTYYLAHYTSGITYEKMDSTRKAIFHYKKAIENRPDHFKSANNLTLLYNRINIPDSALLWMNRAISLSPQEANLYSNRARLFLLQGDVKSALKDYALVSSMHPANAILRFNIGICLEEFGQIKAALHYYQQAVYLQPENQIFSQRLKYLLKK